MRYIFLLTGILGQLIPESDFFGTIVLLRSIGQSFGVNHAPQLAWLVGGYSLTVGTFILFSGRLGDVFGYKRMLILGFAWFSVWFMAAGLAVYSNFTFAIFARVLQGIGPAICLPNALAIFGTAYPPGHRKAMVFAFFGAVAPIGSIVGALFASLLDQVWWPWANWVLAIVLAQMCTLAIWAVPSGPVRPALPAGFKDICHTLDVCGALTGVAALVLFNFAWTQAPISGWSTSTVLVPLILGMLLLAAFAVYESRYTARPLLPFSAINGDFLFVLAAMAGGWASFGIWVLYLAQILERIRGLSPLLTVA